MLSSVTSDIAVEKVPLKANENYTFRSLHSLGQQRLPESLSTPSFKELFMKWGLNECMSFSRFSYDPYLHVANTPFFLKSLFESEEFSASFPVLSMEGNWRPFGRHSVDQVKYTPVTATATNLSIFDPLFEEERGIVRSNGAICGCFEEITDDNLLVRDMLQQILFNPSHEEWECLPAETTRKEFLFFILSHIVQGGSICQYEDEIQPYLDVCKAIYKEMVGVQRVVNDGDEKEKSSLRVTSSVFRIDSIDGAENLFPSSSNSFLYLAIDPVKRFVNLWYKAAI